MLHFAILAFRLGTLSTTAAAAAANHLRSYPNYERWAGAYNAGGQYEVRDRAERLTDPAILAEYGDGYYPLRWVYDKGDYAWRLLNTARSS